MCLSVNLVGNFMAMKKSINLSSKSTLLLTKGEIGYQPVIDSFKASRDILIITYNLSPQDNKLFSALAALSGMERPPKIRLVTNIPNRFPRYYGSAAENYRRTMEAYLGCLDRPDLPRSFESYVNFGNHAKIIATEHAAYVGSANFSDHSQSNWECGTLVHGCKLCRSIINAGSVIIEDSIKHFGYNYLEFARKLQILSSRLTLLADEVEGRCYHVSDFGNRMAFKHELASLPRGFLDSAKQFLQALKALSKRMAEEDKDMKRLVQPLSRSATSALKLCSSGSPLSDFAEFDFDEFVQRAASDATEEGVVSADAVSEVANDRAFERNDILATAAESSLGKFLDLVGVINGVLEDLPEKVTELRNRLDNTR